MGHFSIYRASLYREHYLYNYHTRYLVSGAQTSFFFFVGAGKTRVWAIGCTKLVQCASIPGALFSATTRMHRVKMTADDNAVLC